MHIRSILIAGAILASAFPVLAQELNQCPECHELFAPDGRFCTQCAGPLQPWRPACGNCDRTFAARDHFCSGCGSPLEHAPLYCAGCERPIDASDRFCRLCGHANRAPLAGAPDNEASPKFLSAAATFSQALISEAYGAYKAGQLQRSLRLYSEALRWDREQPRAWAGRGRVRLLLGNRDGALHDFRAARMRDTEVFPGLWEFASGGGNAGLQEHSQPGVWRGSLARYYLDEIDADTLLEIAAGDAEQLCEAHGYIGLRAELEEDFERAREHYEQCVAAGVSNYIEHAYAANWLRMHAGESKVE